MSGKANNRKREFIGVIFQCCRVYSRIYLDKKKKMFAGHCPRCGAKLNILISDSGSESRFFVAS